MGKTLLLEKTLDYARHQGYQTAKLDLQLADIDILANLKTFLQWLCVDVADSLELEPQLDKHWQEVFGLNKNCTRYFQKYLLSVTDTPLVFSFGGGRLAFDRDWFATRVAQVKATLPETPRERNQRLETELKEACTVFGLYHGEIDYLLFSTKVYRHGQFVGFIGANEDGWYSNPRKYGLDRFGKTAQEAIAFLRVQPVVAA